MAGGISSRSVGTPARGTLWAAVGIAGVGLALLVVVGSLLDRDKEPGFGPPQPLPTLQAMAEHPMAGGRFRDPLAVGEEWPRATLIIDEAGCGAADVLRFRALGQARAVVQGDIPPFVAPDEAPLRSGSWSTHSWRLFAGEDPLGRGSDTLLVHCSPEAGSTYEIVQSGLADPQRTLPALHEQYPRDVWIDRLSRPSRSFARDVATDLLILGALTALGGMLVPVRFTMRWARPALAMLAGMSLWSILGLLLLPPWRTAPAMLVVVGLLAAHFRQRGVSTGWAHADLPPLAAFSALVIGIVDFVRSDGWAVLHTDSFSYLLGGWAFASGSMERSLLGAERGLAQQALHGPAFLLGAEGLQSLSPVAFAAGLWLLATVALHRVSATAYGSVAVVTAAAVVALAMSPFMVRTAGLFNSHTLVAALLVGFVALWAATIDGEPEEDRSTAVVAGLLLGAVILLRAEGFLVVGTILLGTLWDSSRRLRWTEAWRIAGVTAIAWGVMIGGLSGIMTGPVSLQGFGLIVGGALLLIAPPALARTSSAVRTVLPPASIAVLWGAVGLLLVAGRGRITVLEASRDNVLGSLGGWGLLGVSATLLLLLAIGQGFPPEFLRRLGPAVTVVAAFFPVSVISTQAFGLVRGGLSAALSGGARVNYFDSLNRMWVHILLLAVLLAITRTTGDWRSHDTSAHSRSADRAGLIRAASQGWALVRTSLVILVVFWVAATWNPRYLASNVAGPVEQRTSQSLLEADDSGAPEVLRAGEVLSQRLDLFGLQALEGDAPERSLCLEPLREGEADGGEVQAVLARLSVGAGSFQLTNETILDASTRTVCVSLPPGGRSEDMPTTALLELLATSDSSPSSWSSTVTVGTVRAAAQRGSSRGESETLDRSLALRASVISSSGSAPGQWPSVTRIEAMTMRGLPAAMAIMIAMLLLLRLRLPAGRRWRGPVSRSADIRSTVSRVGLALGASGVLLGGVFLPAVMERSSLAPVTSAEWYGPLLESLASDGAERVSQTVDPRRLPRPAWLRSRDRLCVQVLLHDPAVAGGGDLRLQLVRGATVATTTALRSEARAEGSEWAGGCFPLAAKAMLDPGADLELVLDRDRTGEGQADVGPVTARLRPALSDEPTAVVVQAGGVRETDGVLVHRFAVLQAPVEEFLWVALARVSAISGFLALVVAMAIGWRQRRSEGSPRGLRAEQS